MAGFQTSPALDFQSSFLNNFNDRIKVQLTLNLLQSDWETQLLMRWNSRIFSIGHIFMPSWHRLIDWLYARPRFIFDACCWPPPGLEISLRLEQLTHFLTFSHSNLQKINKWSVPEIQTLNFGISHNYTVTRGLQAQTLIAHHLQIISTNYREWVF